MPRGRKPDGPQALTGAQRQARYRAHHPATAIRRFGRPTDRRSRPQRWHDAVAELVALKADYARWLDAVPDATRDGATAEALQTIVDLDLDDIIEIQPPRGFGRD